MSTATLTEMITTITKYKRLGFLTDFQGEYKEIIITANRPYNQDFTDLISLTHSCLLQRKMINTIGLR